MATERHYKCKQCSHSWWQRYDASGDNEVFCPECDSYKGRLSKPNVRVDGVAGKASAAASVMQDMLETQYGMTNLKDNLREGDVAAMVDNPVAKAMPAGGMFGGGLPTAPAAPAEVNMQQVLQNARGATTIANREGRNPMAMFHEGAKKGIIPDTLAIAKSRALRDPGSRG